LLLALRESQISLESSRVELGIDGVDQFRCDINIEADYTLDIELRAANATSHPAPCDLVAGVVDLKGGDGGKWGSLSLAEKESLLARVGGCIELLRTLAIVVHFDGKKKDLQVAGKEC
jgi:hypothetical protein